MFCPVALELHPIHCPSNAPISFPGSKTPVQLLQFISNWDSSERATQMPSQLDSVCSHPSSSSSAGAFAQKSSAPNGGKVLAFIVGGKLNIKAREGDVVIELLHGQVSTAEITVETGKRLLIAFVQDTGLAKRNVTSLGWFFLCPLKSKEDVLQSMSSFGCIRDDFSEVVKHNSLAEVLGSGSFGRVTKGLLCNSNSETHVAVKRFHKSVTAKVTRREVEMLVAAQGNDAVIRFQGVFREVAENGALSWNIVFNLHEVGDLEAYALSMGGLPQIKVRPIAWDLFCALRHLGNRNLCHGDVKPQNILVTKAGRAVLTDFGCAMRMVDDTSRLTGTIGYAAPEQLQGGGVDKTSDAFAAGATIYFAVSGHAPFVRESEELTVQATLECRPDLMHPQLQKITYQYRNLLRALLCKQTARLAAATVLLHPVFTASCQPPGAVENHRTFSMELRAFAERIEYDGISSGTETELELESDSMLSSEGNSSGTDRSALPRRLMMRRERDRPRMGSIAEWDKDTLGSLVQSFDTLQMPAKNERRSSRGAAATLAELPVMERPVPMMQARTFTDDPVASTSVRYQRHGKEDSLKSSRAQQASAMFFPPMAAQRSFTQDNQSSLLNSSAAERRRAKSAQSKHSKTVGELPLLFQDPLAAFVGTGLSSSDAEKLSSDSSRSPSPELTVHSRQMSEDRPRVSVSSMFRRASEVRPKTLNDLPMLQNFGSRGKQGGSAEKRIRSLKDLPEYRQLNPATAPRSNSRMKNKILEESTHPSSGFSSGFKRARIRSRSNSTLQVISDSAPFEPQDAVMPQHEGQTNTVIRAEPKRWNDISFDGPVKSQHTIRNRSSISSSLDEKLKQDHLPNSTACCADRMDNVSKVELERKKERDLLRFGSRLWNSISSSTGTPGSPARSAFATMPSFEPSAKIFRDEVMSARASATSSKARTLNEFPAPVRTFSIQPLPGRQLQKGVSTSLTELPSMAQTRFVRQTSERRKARSKFVSKTWSQFPDPSPLIAKPSRTRPQLQQRATTAKADADLSTIEESSMPAMFAPQPRSRTLPNQMAIFDTSPIAAFGFSTRTLGDLSFHSLDVRRDLPDRNTSSSSDAESLSSSSLSSGSRSPSPDNSGLPAASEKEHQMSEGIASASPDEARSRRALSETRSITLNDLPHPSSLLTLRKRRHLSRVQNSASIGKSSKEGQDETVSRPTGGKKDYPDSTQYRSSTWGHFTRQVSARAQTRHR